MIVDCDSLPGRLRDICLGTSVKENGKRHSLAARKHIIGLRLGVPSNTIELPEPTSDIESDDMVKKKPCPTCDENKKKVGLFTTMMDRAASLKSAAVDFLQDGMHVATYEQQEHRISVCKECPVYDDGWCNKERGGCGCKLSLKVIARSAYCPQGKWFAHTDNYRPLVNPTRSLAFHVFPVRGKEWNWHWHIDQIRKYQSAFNGKIVIGISVDKTTATAAEVQKLFEGIPVTDWIIQQNTILAETETHVAMMEAVMTDDPNTIVFRYHTKGVTKAQGSVEQRWAELLWEVSMDLDSVHDAMASHMTCGAMRSLKPLVTRKPGDFFFAGSAYWFRAADASGRDWRYTDASRWWVEYFPAHLFNRHESTCLMYDLTESSVIRQDHFDTFVQPEWDHWRFARGMA